MSNPAEPLTNDPIALQAMLAAERAENERLRQIIKELQRHRFGRRAESLPVEQLLLGLEEAEQVEAEGFAAEDTADPAKREARARKRRANRGALPTHLPRIEQIVDIEGKSCPCCKGMLHVMGEDVAERLDIVPAQFRVIVTRRPKYACRSCEEIVIQAPAPSRLVEGGIPTEATVAHVLVSKYADHLPLYRQSQIYARQGVNLDRSTLADWVGKAAFLLRPIHERLFERLKASGKLFADETTAPVLDPGRGRTKIGQLFAYARDDRSWGGIDPPGVAYLYAPDRKAEQPLRHLQGFVGILQVDGYAGYRALAERNAVSLAFCWAHGRRKLIAAKPKKGSPIVEQALLRIAALYKIEDAIRGSDPDHRLAVRQDLSRPLVDELFTWLAAQAARVSRKSDLGEAMAYMLRRQDGFRLFLDDGCVDIDSNLVENAIRSPAMNRRNALFAGHDEGGRNWARFASLIGTCKMNGVEPYAYMRDLFTKMANGHLARDIDALMPWAYVQQDKDA